MNHRPKKSLGQNFLVDPSIALRIVQALDGRKSSPIIEIGAGRGILTDHLAQLDRPVIAVEKDRELALRIREKYRAATQMQILSEDILKLDLPAILKERRCGRLSFIGNIPFNITSPLLEFLLVNREVVDDLVIMIQREFADRLVSLPGGRAYGGLTVIFNYFSTMEVVLRVKRGSFFPVPKVDATVLRIRFDRKDLEVRADNEDHLLRTVRTLFGWRRNQIQKTLKTHPDFEMDDRSHRILREAMSFPLSNRPEALAIEDFVELSNQLVKLEYD